jgi:hypothetical protein
LKTLANFRWRLTFEPSVAGVEVGVYAIQWAFNASIQSPGAKFLLVALAEHARGPEGEDWTCFPSIKRLARWTAQGERTIERHLNWLIADGWISRELRHRRRRGESAYFYTLHRAKAGSDDIDGVAMSDTSVAPARLAGERRSTARQNEEVHPPISTRSPAKLASAYMDEPGIEPVSESKPDLAMDAGTQFEEFWAAYPNKVEARGARRLFAHLVRSGEVTAGELIDGARVYARAVETRSQTFIKSPTSWLTKGCWADGAGAPQASVARAMAPTAFVGPGDVWAKVMNAKGAAWAASYLAPCGWMATTRTLRPRTVVAATKLRAEIGDLLRHLSVSVLEPTLGQGGAYAQ